MSLSDPIADLLTRVRNALQAGHATVKIPSSRLKEQMCAVLKSEGFIQDYTVEERPAQNDLLRRLKYTADRSPVIQGLRRVSKPSLRVHVRSDAVPQVRNGLGVSILSTSKGVMTGKQARKERVGGELLCEVW